MIRIVKMGGKFYGTEMDIEAEEEQNSISTFVDEGTPVILAEDLEGAAELLDIDPEEIIMAD